MRRWGGREEVRRSEEVGREEVRRSEEVGREGGGKEK